MKLVHYNEYSISTVDTDGLVNLKSQNYIMPIFTIRVDTIAT